MSHIVNIWKSSYIASIIAIVLLGGVFVAWATAPSTPSTTPDLQAVSDTGDSSTDNITTDSTPTFDVECTEDDSTLTMYIEYIDPAVNPGTKYSLADISGGTKTCTAIGSTTMTPNLGFLADGASYKVNISYTEKNTALEESGQSDDLSLTLDRQAPGRPTITTPIEVDNIVVDVEEDDVLISGTTEANSTVYISIGDGTSTISTNVTAQNDGDYTLAGGNELDISSLSDTTVFVVVYATDVAGNTSTIATQPILHTSTTDGSSRPGTPSTPFDLTDASDSGSSNSDNITNDTTPSLTYDCTEIGASVISHVSINGSAHINATIGTCLVVGSQTFSGTTTPVEGTHYAYYTINNGEDSAPSSYSYSRFDYTAPGLATITSPIQGDNYINAAEDEIVALYGTGDPNATVTVRISDGSNPTVSGTTTVTSEGEWSLFGGDELDVTSLDDGALSITVQQTDLAGNAGSISSASVATYDSSAPSTPTVLYPTGDGHMGTSSVAYGECETGSTVTVSSTGLASGNYTGTCTGGLFNISISWTADTTSSDQTLTVYQADPAGNQSSSVTVTGIEISADLGAGSVIVVESTDADTDGGNGLCDFSEALDNANSDDQGHSDCNAGSGDDIIVFSVGSGATTLTPSSQMAGITDTVIIDGTSQPGGATCGESGDEDLDTRSILISLNLEASSTSSSLTVPTSAPNSIIRGLNVYGAGGTNIAMRVYGDSTIIECNHIGTNATGTSAASTRNGGNIRVGGISDGDSDNVMIGGADVNDANVISGGTHNSYGDVSLAEGNNITIQNNRIGTNVAGTSAISDGSARNIVVCGNDSDDLDSSGLYIYDNIIGGGNTGIYASDCSGGTRTVSNIAIRGNHIGVDREGTTALYTSGVIGVQIGGSTVTYDSVTVGGDSTTERNVISGWEGYNGVLFSNNATNIIVQGNYIGVGSDGTTVIPNGNATNGLGGLVFIDAGGPITVGGSNAGEGNVIAGNNTQGSIFSNVLFQAASAPMTNITVKGNWIGTDENETTNIGATKGDGLTFYNTGAGMTNVTVGGTGANDGNVIVGFDNATGGLFSAGATGVNFLNVSDAVFQGNYVGETRDGTSMPNGSGLVVAANGVAVDDILIGGTSTAAHNTISGTSVLHVGNVLLSSTLDNVTYLGNSLDINTSGLSTAGFDLTSAGPGSTGPTANDAGDGDSGSNALLNYPVIMSAVENGDDTITVGFTLDVPASDYRVELFNSTDNEIAGETFLDATENVTHTGSGSESFSATFSTSNLSTGLSYLTMTATEIDNAGGADDLNTYGATSEFSAVVAFNLDVPTVTSQTTANTQPTIAGTFDSTDTKVLTVTISGTAYTTSDSALTVGSDTWSLNLETAGQTLTVGEKYDVSVSAAGDTLTSTDTTTNEIAIFFVPTVHQQTTSSQTPVITGTYDSDNGTVLTITISGTSYTTADSALATAGDSWSLDLSVAGQELAIGAYNVVASTTIDGSPQVDVTTDEIIIQGGNGGGNDNVACTLAASPRGPVTPGTTVALSWTSNISRGQVTSGELTEDGRRRALYELTADDSSGSFTVHPTETTEYTIEDLDGNFLDGPVDCGPVTVLVEGPPPPPGNDCQGTECNPVQDIYGCTDSSANNFDPQANVDNHGCTYDPTDDDILGCDDPIALNYDPTATYDDGSCEYSDDLVGGCTDPFAENYDETVDYDNGECEYLTGPASGDNGVENGGKKRPRRTDGALAFGVPLTPAEQRSLQIIAAIAIAATLPTLVPRIWSLLLSFLGLHRKHRPWGTVYNAVTKQPLDPAYVTLLDSKGVEVASAITDADGRYGFVVDPGTYTIIAQKTNFAFPSKIMAGKKKDELYNDLYCGEKIVIKEKGEIITKNIPMDPVGDDWNEQAKANMGASIFNFFSKHDRIVIRIINSLFFVGLVLSIILLVLYPVTWNIVVFVLYMIMLVLMLLGLTPSRSGRVSFEDDPLPYAIVRIFNANLDREIAHKVTDQNGQYYALVPKAEYYITVEAKDPDKGTYHHVYTSEVFKARRGVINADVRV